VHGNHSEHHQTVGNSNTAFNLGAVNLLIFTVVIIFVAEATVMMLLYLLDLPPNFSTGIIDATLLSLIVAPALYFTFLKPMRESFLKRDQSEESRRRLEEIDRMKSDFISVVTHELRTPVTAIMGYSEIIQNNVKPDRQKEFIEIILKKSEILDRLIDDLEVVNRLEFVKDLQLKQTKNDLLETVNQVCADYSQKLTDISIFLNVPEAPLPMTYDEVRISQVLDNLLSNAVKYSKGFQDTIEVSITDNQDHVVISVKDKGIGMTKDEVRDIYNMFYRAETKRDVVSGLGLGMAIVKNIVKNHNGSIDIISKKGVGTDVKVSLPKLAESQAPEQNFNSKVSETTALIHERCMALA
jgi:signal transduction histidine kinase